MEEALQAAAEASGGDLTIEQVTKLHNDQVCGYVCVRVFIELHITRAIWPSHLINSLSMGDQ